MATVRRFHRRDWLPFQEAFYQAALAAGYPEDPDMNNPDSGGVGSIPMNNPTASECSEGSIMSTPEFDAIKYKEGIRAEWQKTAEAWHEWIPIISRWLSPATELMLDLAALGPGNHVLDLAAGDGDQALAAARRVGPAGYVLATDIAPNFVAFAAQSAQEAGLPHVEARVMDGENLELKDSTFDAVISRLGLMFFPNLQRSLEEIGRVLKPGGRVSVIVFSTPERNPCFSIPVSIIRGHAQLAAPSLGQPGLFSLSAPGTLEEAFGKTGFKDVETRMAREPLRMASAAECLRWRRESSGTLQQMLTGLSETSRRGVWNEIELEFKKFEGPDGFESPCELIVASGAKC